MVKRRVRYRLPMRVTGAPRRGPHLPRRAQGPDDVRVRTAMTSTSRNRIHLAIIVLLLVVIGGLVYTFVVAGSTQPAADGRVAIVLDPAERALMLREMREFVAGVERVTGALARDDMPAVAAAARAVGSAKARDVPVGMLGKLPLEFKTLAFATHRGFDAIAAAADAGATSRQTLTALSELLGQCVTCHARYALAPPPSTAGR